MKKCLFLLSLVICFWTGYGQQTGSFTDTRDGKVYKTVKIGTQTWMAENLAYKAESGCWAYNNDQSNVATYGYLYNWETAKTVCPQGWHLPTDAEWTTLTTYLGGKSVAGGKLKSKKIWYSPNRKATNSSRFTALPGGYRNSGNGAFYDIKNIGYWWTSTEYSTTGAWFVHMHCSTGDADKEYDSKTYSYSIRCLMD